MSRMGELKRRPELRDAILDAAVIEFREAGINAARFANICGRAQISRATGYRLCPSGLEDTLALLHEDTIERVVQAISDRTKRLGPQVRFEQALEAGVRGLRSGLHEAPFVQAVLRQEPDLVVGYLLSRQSGAVIDVLGQYVARCAVNFGATALDLRERGRRFVWKLLAELLVTLPPNPDTALPWPPHEDDAASAEMVKAVLDEFAGEIEMLAGDRPDLAVPPVTVPDETGLPAVLVGRSRLTTHPHHVMADTEEPRRGLPLRSPLR